MPVNDTILRALYSGNPIAKATFDYFASRDRNATETKTDRLEAVIANQGVRVGRSEVIRVMRKLEEAGCGKYVEGRHGHPSRFEWSVELKSVAEVAKGGAISVGRLDDEDADSAVTAAVTDIEVHPYRLRQGLTVQLNLPVDLSTAEASRLADFIKTLPLTQ